MMCAGIIPGLIFAYSKLHALDPATRIELTNKRFRKRVLVCFSRKEERVSRIVNFLERKAKLTVERDDDNRPA